MANTLYMQAGFLPVTGIICTILEIIFSYLAPFGQLIAVKFKTYELRRKQQPSVRLSVCPLPVLRLNEWTYIVIAF